MCFLICRDLEGFYLIIKSLFLPARNGNPKDTMAKAKHASREVYQVSIL